MKWIVAAFLVAGVVVLALVMWEQTGVYRCPIPEDDPFGEGSAKESRLHREERANAMMDKYWDLFRHYPNLVSVGVRTVGWTDIIGITVVVTVKVPQYTIPPEDLIPDCLEGVPVQIKELREGPLPVSP